MVNFEDGTLVKGAYVVIDGKEYEVCPLLFPCGGSVLRGRSVAVVCAVCVFGRQRRAVCGGGSGAAAADHRRHSYGRLYGHGGCPLLPSKPGTQAGDHEGFQLRCLRRPV